MGTSKIPMDLNDVSISPNYRVSDWKAATKKMDWNTMIDIFHNRLEGRYLKPIRLIESDSSIGIFSGFSILALDCLIIETLNQFYQGHDETQGYNNVAFWDFFKNSDFFKNEFTRRKASIFYSHFRCGILHQAQTKKNSVIRKDQSLMIQFVDNNQPDKGLIIDRVLFHQAVENEITSYTGNLKKGGNANSNLRKNFIKKMNIICVIKQK